MSLLRADAIITESSRYTGIPFTRGDAQVNAEGDTDLHRTRLDRAAAVRRTPRKSLVVVIPENHVLSAEAVVEELPPSHEHDPVDVIVACAGQPANLGALVRRVRDIQVLLAPAGTSSQDLRELGMSRAPGDIVTLLGAAAAPAMMGEVRIVST